MPEIKINANPGTQGEFLLNQKPASQQNTPHASHTHEIQNTYHIPEAHLTPFSALSMYPENVHFEDQEEDEEIILFVRRSFAVNIPWISLVIFLTLLLPIVMVLSPITLPFIKISFATDIVFILFYLLMLFGYALVNYSIWYFNVTLVTNIRIVDVDISGVLFRNVSETKLDLVQDVSYTQFGVVASLFDYGNITIQTAGELNNFEIDHAPKPAEIIHMIGDLIGKKPQL